MRLVRIYKEIMGLTFRRKCSWIYGLLLRSRACGKKQRYSLMSAEKAKVAMIRKTGKRFDSYTCLWCGKYHIGKNNQT